MSSTIKNVLCKTCLILIIGFTFLTASYAHAQPQTVVLRVDGDNGALPPPFGIADGSDWGNTAFKFLQDALAEAEERVVDPDITVHLWVAATDPSNPYRPDQDAVNPGGTGAKEATFLLDFNNITILGGFAGGETDPLFRDPELNVTTLTGLLGTTAEEVCGDPGAGNCTVAHGTPGCDDADCCSMVCAADPSCCQFEWDASCASLASDVCSICGPGAGACNLDNGTPGCDDAECCAAVCEIAPFCCETAWDFICVALAFDPLNPICPPDDPPALPRTYHVVTADGVSASVRLDGFTITGGVATGLNLLNDLGGGMLVLNASPAVVRCVFMNNSAPGHGGGAIAMKDSGHPIIVNCQFLNNDASEGGAIHSEGGTVGATFVNCLFAGNAAGGNLSQH